MSFLSYKNFLNTIICEKIRNYQQQKAKYEKNLIFELIKN